MSQSDLELALRLVTEEIQQVEKTIYSLSHEEQKLLLERLKSRIKYKKSSKLNIPQLGKEMQEMANDPEIQAEISAINQKFLITEMDGLIKETI